MNKLQYTVIKTKNQYKEYCKILEKLFESEGTANTIQDEIELLTLLISKYDEENNSFSERDPVVLLKHLMASNNLKAKDLVDILDVSKGLISDILNYKKGLSKEVIRKLAENFKVSQAAFNRPYTLKSNLNLTLRNARVMNTSKKMEGRV